MRAGPGSRKTRLRGKRANIEISIESLTKLMIAAFSIVLLLSVGYMLMRPFLDSDDAIVLASFEAFAVHDLSYAYTYDKTTGTTLTLDRPGGSGEYLLRYAADKTEFSFTAKRCRAGGGPCLCLVDKEEGAIDCRQMPYALEIRYATRSGQQVASAGCIGISCSAIPDTDRKGDLKRTVAVTITKSGGGMLVTYGPLTPVGGLPT